MRWRLCNQPHDLPQQPARTKLLGRLRRLGLLEVPDCLYWEHGWLVWPWRNVSRRGLAFELGLTLQDRAMTRHVCRWCKQRKLGPYADVPSHGLYSSG